MVIQRIQSLFLGIAVFLIFLLTLAIPIGSVLGLANVYSADWWPLLILNLLAAIMALAAIFLYNNIPLQIKLVKFSIVTIICSFVVFLVGWLIPSHLGVAKKVILPIIFYAASAFCLYKAYLGIEKDRKTLEESNRIR